jgi:hypothetical protein
MNRPQKPILRSLHLQLCITYKARVVCSISTKPRAFLQSRYNNIFKCTCSVVDIRECLNFSTEWFSQKSHLKNYSQMHEVKSNVVKNFGILFISKNITHLNLGRWPIDFITSSAGFFWLTSGRTSSWTRARCRFHASPFLPKKFSSLIFNVITPTNLNTSENYWLKCCI